jgi:hypothetical protein
MYRRSATNSRSHTNPLQMLEAKALGWVGVARLQEGEREWDFADARPPIKGPRASDDVAVTNILVKIFGRIWYLVEKFLSFDYGPADKR